MSEFDTASEGAKMDFAKDMSYGDYLGLDAILSSQHPLSAAHDEMLFIVQHQTSELWMRLAKASLRSLPLRLARISRSEIFSLSW